MLTHRRALLNDPCLASSKDWVKQCAVAAARMRVVIPNPEVMMMVCESICSSWGRGTEVSSACIKLQEGGLTRRGYTLYHPHVL